MSDRRFMDRLRHAFGVDDAESFAPTEREKAVVERICREIVRRRMTLPASMMLEMSRPLNYLGAQALHFFTPFATTLVDSQAWNDFAAFVERRGSVEYLIRRIDDFEAEASRVADGMESSDRDDPPPASERTSRAESVDEAPDSNGDREKD